MSSIQTFLIVDIRGYTQLTETLGDEAAAELASAFAALVREETDSHGGRVIELRGDEALAVFPSARGALRAAIAVQERIRAQPASFQVGIGLDAGEAVPMEEGFRGGAINVAARLCDLAMAGEVLSTDTVTRLAGRVPSLSFEDRGAKLLKGLTEPVRVMVVRGRERAVATEASPPAFSSPVGTAGLRVDVAATSLPVGGFLGARPEGPIVAREEELAGLRSILDRVAAGEGRLVLLDGEPGVGKTRLAQEVALEALTRGFLVAPASCFEERQTTALYPFREALRALAAAAPADVRADLPARWPYLATLLPGLVGTGAAPSPSQRARQEGSVEGTRDPDVVSTLVVPQTSHLGNGMPILPVASGEGSLDSLFATLADVLRVLAERTPVALMIDDLQWADSSSLDLLAFLARATRASRVLLLGTYRGVEVDSQHPLFAIALQLGRQRLVEWVPVRRLTGEGTAALLASAVGEAGAQRAPPAHPGPDGRVPSQDIPQRFVQQVQDRTEGNPFFVLELLRSLLDRGVVQPRTGRWTIGRNVEVPAAVRALIEERLRRLDESAQDVLRQASVLGQAFTFDDLAALTGSSEEEIERALEAAAAARLVRYTGGDGYAFEHALTREALYLDLSPRRRRRLHLAAGEALERPGAAAWDTTFEPRGVPSGPRLAGRSRAGELAWHFAHAEDRARALRYALAAAEAAEQVFAHRDAEDHYRMALDLIWESGDDRVEAELLERLGAVLGVMGRYDEAIVTLERALQVYERAGDGLVPAGRDVEPASRDLEPDLRAQAGPGPRGHPRLEEQRRLVARIGLLHAQRGTPEEGIVRLQPLLDADAKPSPGLARLYIALAQLSLGSGDISRGLEAAERAAGMARALGDDTLAAEADVRRGEALVLLSRDREARQAVEWIIERPSASNPIFGPKGVPSGPRLAGRTSEAAWEADLSTVSRALNGMGAVFLRSGEFRQSKAYRSRALQLAERIGDPNRVAVSALNLAEVCFYLGEWEEARTRTHQAEETLGTAASPQLTMYMHLLYGTLDTATGDWARATDHLERVIAIARERGDAVAWNRLAGDPVEAHLLLAERELWQGNLRAARSRLEPLLANWPAGRFQTGEGSLAGQPVPGQRVDLLLMLAQVLLAGGETSAADRLVVRAIEGATRAHTRLGLLHGLIVQGAIRSREGRTTEATNLLEGALSLARRMPYPYAVGRILWELAGVEGSDEEIRRVRLEEALATFRRLGAQPYVERAERVTLS